MPPPTTQKISAKIGISILSNPTYLTLPGIGDVIGVLSIVAKPGSAAEIEAGQAETAAKAGSNRSQLYAKSAAQSAG